MLTRLGLALTALTILPAPWLRQRVVSAIDQAGSVGWYPLIGFGIGAVMAGCDWLARQVVSPHLAAIAVIAVGVAITGGLHWDGLMDAADGWFGGRDSQSALAIMRDSRVGAFGVLAALGCAATYWTLLAEARDDSRLAWLIAAPGLARWAGAVSIVVWPYARASGAGAALRSAGRRDALLATLFAATAAIGVGWGPAAIGFAVVGAIAGLVGLAATRRLGGLTGDCYGAVILAAEIAAFGVGANLPGVARGLP